MSDLMNELINDEAVYRTAPATPGLLIILGIHELFANTSHLTNTIPIPICKF